MGIILGYYRDAYWSTSISECHKECVSWELGTSRSFTSWFCNWKNWHCDFKWKKLGRGCTLMNSDHVDGYMFVFFFLNLGYPSLFSHVVSTGWRGEASRKAHMWEAKTAPSIFLGDYGHPLSIFGFASITVAFNNMKPWLSEESGYDWIRPTSSIGPFVNHLLKKNLKKIFPSFAKKKGALYFWVGLVWLLLVVSLVTPKTHITLKKWWLADWQTAFPLKLPFIFCFFFRKGCWGRRPLFFFRLVRLLRFLNLPQLPRRLDRATAGQNPCQSGGSLLWKKWGTCLQCWEFRNAPNV